MYQRYRQVHFIGIGGIGMSGIAELLIKLGYKITGSDLRESDITRRLTSLGARITLGHSVKNLEQVDVVVISSAIKEDNPEIIAARNRLIPVISRAEMLAELMRLKYSLAVAGAHGKTTTTSILAAFLAAGKLDPTVIVGGTVVTLGSNVSLGQGDFLVAEADESDGSFNQLSPTVVVVTNIDHEHMDYYLTDEALDDAFVNFMNKVPFYGAIILCLDNLRLNSLMTRLRKRVITYGFSSRADYQACSLVSEGMNQSYKIYLRNQFKGIVHLPFPGTHYVLNSLGALAAAHEVGVDLTTAIATCSKLSGVKRRFERRGYTLQGALVIDDYAHHPTEIIATLKAARTVWPKKRFIVCFQPHRYTRTKDLFYQFTRCFYEADILLLLDIYSANEDFDLAMNAKQLVKAIRIDGHKWVEYVGGQVAAKARLADLVTSSDILFTMGAGDIWQLSEDLVVNSKIMETNIEL